MLVLVLVLVAVAGDAGIEPDTVTGSRVMSLLSSVVVTEPTKSKADPLLAPEQTPLVVPSIEQVKRLNL